ncbi:MAG TPA: SRPBCC family protein [Herminiimonas sp.]|jgi:ribosome-associated toxin RatA of RatAB toxin-antitoxin module|nr:SRPBCC family protein [Herminiimonas sp.]
MRFLPFSLLRSAAGHPACKTMARLIGISLVLLTCLNTAYSAEPFTVDAARHGDAVQINASATVRAPLALIWSTLTDYDHLAEFIPGMNKSKLMERQGKTSIVEQSGYAHLWFFRFPINVTVEAIEQSSSVMTVRLLKGNLKRLEGSYDVEKINGDDTYTLRWTGIIEPGINVPGAIATPLMRKNISEQFLGMVTEIERRAAQQHAPPG